MDIVNSTGQRGPERPLFTGKMKGRLNGVILANLRLGRRGGAWVFFFVIMSDQEISGKNINVCTPLS